MDFFYAVLLAAAGAPVLLIVLATARAVAGSRPRWQCRDEPSHEIGSPDGGQPGGFSEGGDRGSKPNRGRPGVREPRRPLRPAGSGAAALELPTEDAPLAVDGLPLERRLLPFPALPRLAS